MAIEVVQRIDLSIVPSLKGVERSINQQMRSVNTTQAGKQAGEGYASGFGGAAKKLTGVLAGAFAAAKIGNFAADAIAQASDMEESASKIGVVFGDAQADIDTFANKGAKALGMSELAAKNAAASFGIFGKSAKLTGKENAAFSTDLTSLAVDMASFSNTSPEEAIEALSSALRGEAEPIRKYGVLLDDASLRQQALSMGLIKTTKDALTPQQKVLASHALIMKQTSDAQGDFERTSGGLANQQRILAAQWEDSKGKLGAAFLPAVTAVVSGLNDKLFPALTMVGTKVSEAFTAFKTSDFAATLGTGFEQIKTDAMKGFEGLQPTFAQGWAILAKGDFVGGGALAEDSPLTDFLFTIREGFESIGPILQEVGGTLFGALVDVFRELWPTVKQLLPTLMQLFSLFNPLTLIFKTLLPVLPQIAEVFGNLARTLAGALSKALDAIVPILADLIEAILPPLMGLVADLVPFFVDLGEIVGEVAGVLAEGIADAVVALTPLFDALVGVIGELIPFISDLIKSLLPPLLGLFDSLVPLVQGVLDVLVPLISSIADALIPVIQGLMPIVKTVFEFISTTIGNVVKIFQGLIDVVTGIFTGDWKKVWEGVRDIFGGIWDQIKNIFGTLWTVISEFFTNFGPMIWDIISGAAGFIAEKGGEFLGWLWDGIQTKAEELWTWFTSLPETVWGLVLVAATWLGEKGAEFIGWLWEGVKTGAANLWTWFTALPGAIWDLVLAAAGFIGEKGAEFIGWLWEGIKTGAENLWTWFTGLPAAAWNLVLAGAAFVAEKGAEFIKWLWEGTDGNGGIKGGAQAIWDFFTGLPEKIGGFLLTIVGKIAQIGKDIIGWIVEGIVEVAGDIWTAITDALTDSQAEDPLVGGFTGQGGGAVFGGTARGGVVPRGFAAGGIIPGIDPGRRDNVLGRLPNGQAWGLRSGESVFVPEFTRAIGGAPTVEAWNRLAEQGRLGQIGVGVTGGFALGGVAGAKAAAKQLGSDLAWAYANDTIEAIKTRPVAGGGRGARRT